MVLNVASTHTGQFATKTEGRTVEREHLEIKHKKLGTVRKYLFVINIACKPLPAHPVIQMYRIA
jgi:hypothetical protein